MKNIMVKVKRQSVNAVTIYIRMTGTDVKGR